MPWAPLQEKGRPKKLLILYLIFPGRVISLEIDPQSEGGKRAEKAHTSFLSTVSFGLSLSLCLSLFTDTDPIIMTLRLLQEQPLLELRRAT